MVSTVPPWDSRSVPHESLLSRGGFFVQALENMRCCGHVPPELGGQVGLKPYARGACPNCDDHVCVQDRWTPLPCFTRGDWMHCYFYERLANLGACYTPIHRYLYFGLSIGLSSRHRWRCIRWSLDLGEVCPSYRLGARLRTHQRRWGVSRSSPLMQTSARGNHRGKCL